MNLATMIAKAKKPKRPSKFNRKAYKYKFSTKATRLNCISCRKLTQRVIDNEEKQQA